MATLQKVPLEHRQEALKQAVQQIEKQFGKGSIMRLGSDAKLDIDGISTGSLGLDIAIGGMGIPRGRVAEVFGPESSGKTTLCLHVAASAQREGGVVAFIDAENALDPAYARRIGVDLNNLLLSQPDCGEQALEIAELLVRSSAVDVVIIDSVAALVPRAELEGDMGDSHMGLQARLMSQALRKLSGAINRSRTCVIFTNQLREKIGVMFGSPETTPGGRALKFYASVRIDMRRITSLKEGDRVTGNRVRCKVVKNKIAPPFKIHEFDIIFSEGISREGDLIDLGVEARLVQKSGSWFSFGKVRLGQGREAAREHLRENKDVAAQLESEIRKAVGLVPKEGPAAAAPAAENETAKGAVKAIMKEEEEEKEMEMEAGASPAGSRRNSR